MTIAGCVAVSAAADRITLRDLAPAFSAVADISPDTPIGFAPAPGVRRIFSLPELRRLAARFGIAAPPEREICVERPVALLTTGRLLESMQRELPRAHIEVLGFSRLPAPEGEIEFRASGLRQTVAGEFWNGNVRYAIGKRFAVWAKVRVRVPSERVVANASLTSGHVVASEELRVESGEMFPAPDIFFHSIEVVAGRVLRRSVRAGTPLRMQWFDAAMDVSRGDVVRVEVRSGGARLETQAVAEAGGLVGQTILVRNPDSKKTFRARIKGKGKVSVGL